MVLSANEGRGFIRLPARRLLCTAPPSPTGLPCEGDGFDAPLLDICERLGVRDKVRCGAHCDDGRFLRPGSLEDVCWLWGDSCSVSVAIVGSRGSRDMPFGLDARGSFGRGFELGRLETGRGRGRAFVVEETEAEVLVLEAVGLITFVVLLNPNLGPVFRYSVEADGRSRIDLAPAVAPAGPGPAARSLLEGEGRVVVTRGAGKRDIGRGRPLDLPAWAGVCSMVTCLYLLDARIATRDANSGA